MFSCDSKKKKSNKSNITEILFQIDNNIRNFSSLYFGIVITKMKIIMQFMGMNHRDIYMWIFWEEGRHLVNLISFAMCWFSNFSFLKLLLCIVFRYIISNCFAAILSRKNKTNTSILYANFFAFLRVTRTIKRLLLR